MGYAEPNKIRDNLKLSEGVAYENAGAKVVQSPEPAVAPSTAEYAAVDWLHQGGP